MAIQNGVVVIWSMENGACCWFLFFFFPYQKCRGREQARLYRAQNYNYNQSTRSPAVVTHCLFDLTRKRYSNDTYKLPWKVILGPVVLNQVNRRNFDPSCADNCRKAQNVVARSPRQPEIQSWVVGEKRSSVSGQASPRVAECSLCSLPVPHSTAGTGFR